MSDLTLECRERIIHEALRQENEKAHYAKTAYGHMFDVAGHPIGDPPLRPGSVEFIGARGPTAVQINQVPEAGRAAMRLVRFAVTSSLGGRRVCAGRCAVSTGLTVGDPGNPVHLANPDRHSWRRPKDTPEDLQVVEGECCVKRRHFDCLGFVTWCLWKALGPDFPQCLATFSVQAYRDQAELRPRTGPLLPGDLLFDTGNQHIGIVVSDAHVAHSAGHRWGVRRTLINGNIYPRDGQSESQGTGNWGPQAGRLTLEILARLRRIGSHSQAEPAVR